MVMTDFSLAIILDCLSMFCNESPIENLNRAFRIVNRDRSTTDFLKTPLHFCAAFMMKLSKKHATAKGCKKFSKKSQVHFSSR